MGVRVHAAEDGVAPVSAPDWAEVYTAHAHHLMRLATVLVGRDDAADLVAEGVHRAMRSGSWSGVLEPRAYLVRIVVNTASDERRRRSRRERREQRASRLEGGGVYVPGGPDVDVRAALAELSPQQRAVVFLTYWEDRSIPDVAAVLDVSEGTVRRQLARAKDRLRKVLHE